MWVRACACLCVCMCACMCACVCVSLFFALIKKNTQTSKQTHLSPGSLRPSRIHTTWGFLKFHKIRILHFLVMYRKRRYLSGIQPFCLDWSVKQREVLWLTILQRPQREGLRTTAYRLNPTLKQGSQGLNHRNLHYRVTSSGQATRTLESPHSSI